MKSQKINRATSSVQRMVRPQKVKWVDIPIEYMPLPDGTFGIVKYNNVTTKLGRKMGY